MANPVYQSQVIAIGSGIPFSVANTGSFGNNGALTLGTALATTYSGGIYLYFPAGAIVAGSLAGWYWTVMSSSTLGVVYNNTYVSGPVSAPVTLVPFVTTGPGAYTGVVLAVTGPSIPLPAANVVQAASAVRVSAQYSHNNSAGAKTKTITLGGTVIMTEADTTTQSFVTQVLGFEKNSAALMSSSAGAATGGLGAVNTPLNYNTAANFASQTAPPTLALTLQIATATDVIVLEGFLVEIFQLGV